VSKATVAEIWKQLVGIEVTKSAIVVITTIGVEMVVALITNVVKGGILIGSVENLGSGLGGILIIRNLNWSP
jgi:hypothetical protein